MSAVLVEASVLASRASTSGLSLPSLPPTDEVPSFESLMTQARATRGQPEAVPPAPAVTPVESRSAPVQGDSVGDVILRGLHKASAEIRTSWQTIPAAAVQGNLSMADAVTLQAKMSMMTVQCEMLGKAVAKVSQDIDQTVRTQ